MTWIVAHQVSLQGWALPWVLLAAVAAFTLLTVASYYILRYRMEELTAVGQNVLVSPIEDRGTEHPKGQVDSIQLEIRFDDSARYQSGGTFIEPYFRIGVYNPGPHVARNVELSIEVITGPDADYFRGFLPHKLQTVDGKEKRCDINPDRDELFEFAVYKHHEENKVPGVLLQIGGIRLYPFHNKTALSEHLFLTYNQHFHFYLKACCGNGPSKTAILYAQVGGHENYPYIGIYRLDNLLT